MSYLNTFLTYGKVKQLNSDIPLCVSLYSHREFKGECEGEMLKSTFQARHRLETVGNELFYLPGESGTPEQVFRHDEKKNSCDL